MQHTFLQTNRNPETRISAFNPMKTYSISHRMLVFACGVASYLLTLGVLAYMAGFLGNFIVPKPLDAAAQIPFWPALLTNFGLLLLFSIQHSVMARPAFKSWW